MTLQHRCSIAILCLVALAKSTREGNCAPYYAVAVRGSTLAGELAVWRVEDDGSISPHWSTSLPAGALKVDVDPFGRYAIFVVEEGFQNFRTEVWRVNSDLSLTQADYLAIPGVLPAPEFNCLSQDGKWFVAFITDVNQDPAQFSLGAFSINDDLQIAVGGQSFLFSQDSDFASISTLTASNLGSHTVLASAGSASKLFVFHLTSTGDVIWDGAQVVEFKGDGLPGKLAARLDGRLAIAGSPGENVGAYSFSIDASGEVQLVDSFDQPSDLTDNEFHPDGQSVVGGGAGAFRVDIRRDGAFPESGLHLNMGSTGSELATITHDGRFALFGNINNSGSRSTIATYSLEGGGLTLVRELRVPGSWEDLEIIPPRTEELLGDANADGLRDIEDVVTYINHFNDDPDFGGPTDPTIAGPVPRARADATQDGKIDHEDLEWLIDFLLTN